MIQGFSKLESECPSLFLLTLSVGEVLDDGTGRFM